MVQRISIDSSSITYQNAEILDKSEWGSDVPDLFEDSQIVFRCDKKTFVLPDYNIYLIQIRGGRVNVPAGARRVSRILVAGDLNYSDCYLVSPDMYDSLGVPQIFRPYEQFVWICKDGLFVTVDFNVVYVTL